MTAEAKLAESLAVMKERDMMIEEIDNLFMTLRDEHRSSQKMGTD
jgi:hypothetical protein